MRNLLLGAALCVGMLASAANGKETVPNNFEDVNIEKSNFSLAPRVEMNTFEKLEKSTENLFTVEAVFFGCGDIGNSLYRQLVAGGMSHREARAERRDEVRECIGGRWWSIDFGTS